jgi:hypothetical protein
MADSRGSRLAAGAHLWARLALGLMIVGPSIVLVYAWVEVLNHPGTTIVDGYWIGRLPWTPLGVLITLTGAVLGLASGAIAIALEGGWWRRALIVPAFVASAAWWLTGLGVLPYPRFHGPDPVTFAYDLPVAATLLVVMPAALLATLCLTPRMESAQRTRLRPLPPRETWSDPTASPDDTPT